ncbi:TrmB family transcriptional regulator [Halomicrococcus sp. NG-SE-24]|uniref:TrmB family transcriptional regulator n=1 Tax=Halomicrococcus sp. NG-SE-24 TaxID=3436928 RepID=UPI003D953070
MTSNERYEHAVDLLQQLGLKEYEAKCFVVLSRLPKGTAKQISEQSDVPRTRVYDATRVLEARGLVEVQHSSPQYFRAVPIDEAVETLRQQYESRFADLRDAVEGLGESTAEADDTVHEVWSLSGSEGIATRTQQLIDEAEDEIVLIIGTEEVLSEELFEHLSDAAANDISLIIGTLSEGVREAIDQRLDAKVFITGLDWLKAPSNDDENAVIRKETAIGRLLMVDRETIFVSSLDPASGKEQAVFGRGFGNGLVVIVRRLMATGLLASEDPGT